MKKKVVVAVLAVVLACAFALTGCAKKEKVKVIDIKLTDEEYAFGVDKDQPELKNKINAILQEIMDDGTLGTISEKYFDDSKVNERVKVPKGTVDNSKADEQLVVATNVPFEPFEYSDDNGTTFSGIDIEIMDLIAKRLGMDLVIVHIEDFDAVVTQVQTHMCDVAAAGLTVTEERKESVDFTTSYYKASQVLIVRESNTDFDNCKTTADVEAVLASYKKDKKKAGFQNGTTGQVYLEGDSEKGEDGFGFPGFPNIKRMGSATAALSIQDLSNGNLDLVVLDEMPAKSMVNHINALI